MPCTSRPAAALGMVCAATPVAYVRTDTGSIPEPARSEESEASAMAGLKERLVERVETFQERMHEEIVQAKQRAADGFRSAVKGGARSSSFGRPPTGRPPTGRPPSLTRRRA